MKYFETATLDFHCQFKGTKKRQILSTYYDTLPYIAYIQYVWKHWYKCVFWWPAEEMS